MSAPTGFLNPQVPSPAPSLFKYGTILSCYTRKAGFFAVDRGSSGRVTTRRRRVSIISMIDSDDSTLIELAQNRDEAAFAELVRRYQAAVWGRVCRILGRSPENEDAVQEVFLRTLTSLPKVKWDQPFGPWIMRITTNYCIDQLRRRKTRKDKLWSDLSVAEEVQASARTASEDDGTAPPPDEPDKFERIAHGLLDRLKPRRRTAFVLREIENKSYEEVAHSLGVSELTARVLVSRARADLHKGYLRLEADQGLRG